MVNGYLKNHRNILLTVFGFAAAAGAWWSLLQAEDRWNQADKIDSLIHEIDHLRETTAESRETLAINIERALADRWLVYEERDLDDLEDRLAIIEEAVKALKGIGEEKMFEEWAARLRKRVERRRVELERMRQEGIKKGARLLKEG